MAVKGVSGLNGLNGVNDVNDMNGVNDRKSIVEQRRCVICAAGPVGNAEALRPLLRPDDWVIAADGGVSLDRRLPDSGRDRRAAGSYRGKFRGAAVPSPAGGQSGDGG